MISEFEKLRKPDEVSHLTLLQYENMNSEQKIRLSNRIRQWALKARENLPRDHGVFCLVVAHLLKNSHRYFDLDRPSDIQQQILEDKSMNESTREKMVEQFKDANKKVREAELKGKRRLVQQKQLVKSLKSMYHMFRNMSFMSGIPLKTVHSWCSLPKVKCHKATEMSKMRQKEFEQFLLQDSILFAHPSKKFAGKQFLRGTLEETRKKYLAQEDYHKFGIISFSSMKKYRPSYIMLCGDAPLDQCLCDRYENCEQLLKALFVIGIKGIPSNRFCAVDCVICSERIRQVGSESTFPRMSCLLGQCNSCGIEALENAIRSANKGLIEYSK